jgi:asparagine synthase (glutamine-hydrolysing)
MCGIAGFLDHQSTPTNSCDSLDRMLGAIVHRGPDDQGRLIDRELQMGMRRLSIIDLADGHQPIFDESGRYAVIFNGEIYNYRELRMDLLARGHILKTHSDTEVIIHLFEDFGPNCLEHLRGMFAIAVWDNHTRKLFLARDRLGEKPLYYTQPTGLFVFASEIKSLLQHPAVTASPNLQAISHYLSLKYTPAPQTMFAGIHSLPPGHYLIASADGISIKQYWDIPFGTSEDERSNIKSDAEYADELLSLLRESVRLRLRSDVPFGAFLSGGLDSSTIVALMAQQLNDPVNTFSVGFDGAGSNDELPYAHLVAQHFGCKHHTLKITSDDFLRYADTVLWHLDQPIADQATIATFLVSKLASQHVKMVLTGEGGDELFAGYARYRGDQFEPWFRWMPKPVPKYLRSIANQLPGLRRAKIAINALTQSDEATRFANWFPMFSDDAKQTLFSAQAESLRTGAAKVFSRQLADCRSTDSLSRMLYVDSKLWLPDYLLLRGDKLTMANSLEARIPLLDHKLVEFAAGLPNHLKLNGANRKVLLRRVASNLLPAQIINRPKQGFPIPIERWLQVEVRSLMQDMLSKRSIESRGLLNAKYVDQLVTQHLSGYADHSTQLWGLISLEMWFRRFIDSSPSDNRPQNGSIPVGELAC